MFSLFVICILALLSGTEQEIIIIPESVTIVENQDVNFTCSYDNRSTTATIGFVKWEERYNDYSIGIAVTTYSGNCSINLLNTPAITSCKNNNVYYVTWKNVTRRKHNKRIKCLMNINGKLIDSKNEASVKVNVPVEYINITSPKKVDVEVVENNTLSVWCLTSASRPRPNITCFVQKHLHDGNRTYIGSAYPSTEYEENMTTTLSLLQYRGSRSDNNHFILCTANNIVSIPPVESNTVQLNVKYPPNIGPIANVTVIEGDSVNKTCPVTRGNPFDTSVKWKKEREARILEQSAEGILYLANISRKDDMRYVCEANNTMSPSDSQSVYGRSNGWFKLTVAYPPKVNKMNDVRVIENSSYRRRCVATPGYPNEVSYRWTRLLDSFARSEQDLVIEKVSRNDSSIYVCTVNNTISPTNGMTVYGNHSSSFHLFVLYPPVIDAMDNITVVGGDSVNRTCQVTPGNPQNISIKWTKQGHTISNTPFLYIANVSERDDGVYICEVNNTMISSEGKAIYHKIFLFFKLTIADFPHQPTELKQIQDLLTDTSITLIWKPGFNGGTPQHFSITYKSDKDQNRETIILQDTGETVMYFTIRGLKSNTFYEFQIVAVNIKGSSAISVLRIQTKARDTTTKPKDHVGLVAGSITGVLGITVGIVLLEKGKRQKKRRDTCCKRV